MSSKTNKPLSRAEALSGREGLMPVVNRHFVNDHKIKGPFPEGLECAVFGLGCFWGAERKFWQQKGVYSTAVGYSAGFTENPSYEEVCSGLTGHNEVVLVVYDPDDCGYDALLTVFWESHNPTQGMAQGNDVGTQYRSGIYTFNEQQQRLALDSKQRFQAALSEAGLSKITTEVLSMGEFYYAEEYHQQYLAKNPAGYCGLGGVGVCFPLPSPPD